MGQLLSYPLWAAPDGAAGQVKDKGSCAGAAYLLWPSVGVSQGSFCSCGNISLIRERVFPRLSPGNAQGSWPWETGFLDLLSINYLTWEKTPFALWPCWMRSQVPVGSPAFPCC